MNEKIKAHVTKYNESQGWGVDEDTLIETITDEKVICKGAESSHRWWSDQFRVCEIDGMLIGYWWAITTGDDSPHDKGWEFEPESICLVEKKEETKVVTTYEIIK